MLACFSASALHAEPCRFAGAVQQSRARVASPPLLCLEVKNRGYTVSSIAQVWRTVAQLQLQQLVALWVVDHAHLAIVRAAAPGARMIWGFMDQPFQDAVSSVAVARAVPPNIPVRCNRERACDCGSCCALDRLLCVRLSQNMKQRVSKQAPPIAVRASLPAHWPCHEQCRAIALQRQIISRDCRRV